MQLFIPMLRRLPGAGLEALIPRRCVACNALYRPPGGFLRQDDGVRRQDEWAYLLDDFLCPQCAQGIRQIGSPLCTCCGAPFEASEGVDHECDRCFQQPPAFQRARSVSHYEGGLRALIHHLKYKGYVQVARPLGRMLWDAFTAYWQAARIDLVVPVPLHHKRLRRRGFNQALQLIRRWPRLADRQGVVFEKQRIAPGVLVRRHNTPPQTGLDSKQRIDNVQGAFHVKIPGTVKGNNILLVDDVFTTGATVNACARELIRCGAAQVHVLTLARSL